MCYTSGCIALLAAALILTALGLAAMYLSILIFVVICRKGWPRDKVHHWLARLFCRIFRLPIGKELRRFKTSIWNKYHFDDQRSDQLIQNKDRAIAYVERIIDREINKARGILPFNSILLVMVNFSHEYLKNFHSTNLCTEFLIHNTYKIILIDLGLSCVLLLEMFAVFWGQVELYNEWEEEIETSIRLSRNRAMVLDVTIVVSAVCLIVILAIDVALPIFASP